MCFWGAQAFSPEQGPSWGSRIAISHAQAEVLVEISQELAWSPHQCLWAVSQSLLNFHWFFHQLLGYFFSTEILGSVQVGHMGLELHHFFWVAISSHWIFLVFLMKSWSFFCQRKFWVLFKLATCLLEVQVSKAVDGRLALVVGREQLDLFDIWREICWFACNFKRNVVFLERNQRR